jgi:hypothetical protein
MQKEIKMDTNKERDIKRPRKLVFLLQLAGSERSMGPRPIAEQWRKLRGPKVRLIKLNYISLKRFHFRNVRLSQGIYRIINGKRSDERSQLPINCEARREIEETVRHLVPPDFHLSPTLPVVCLTNVWTEDTGTFLQTESHPQVIP